MSTQTTPEGGRHFEWTISDRLRKAREEAGFTQQQLAELIEVSQRTVANYESPTYKGSRKPIAVRRWGLATGYDFDLLMTGVPSDPDGGGGLHIRRSGCNADVLDFRARRSDPSAVPTLPGQKAA